MPTFPGTTGIEAVWLLLFISLAFNAVTVVGTVTAICCQISMKCAEWRAAKKSAMKEYYFITKYGEKVHFTESARRWQEVSIYAPFDLAQSAFMWSKVDRFQRKPIN